MLLGSAACYALKALGFVVPEHYLEKPLVAQLVAMFPVALLSALLAVVTVGQGMAVVVDARLAAVAAFPAAAPPAAAPAAAAARPPIRPAPPPAPRTRPWPPATTPTEKTASAHGSP